MFNFFKRSDKLATSSAARPRNPSTKTPRARGVDPLDPLPLPQVQEGNLDSDWAMWEDSVREQDSQFPPQFLDTVPSRFPPSQQEDGGEPDADPFAQVSRHAP